MSEQDELRAVIDAAQNRYLAAIDDFPDLVLETEPAVGAWSPRDVTGHVVDWQQEILAAAKHILGAKKPAWHPIKDGAGYNMTQAAMRGTDSWHAVRQDFVDVREQIFEFIDGLDAQQLKAIGPYPWGEIGDLRRLLYDIASHLDEHAAQLEAWRLKRAGVRLDRGYERN
ncbi:MAG TPA: DinB family protein [Nitrolancea sp.]|nr:DinB family protein [Nitrolancea sp.]